MYIDFNEDHFQEYLLFIFDSLVRYYQAFYERGIVRGFHDNDV